MPYERRSRLAASILQAWARRTPVAQSLFDLIDLVAAAGTEVVRVVGPDRRGDIQYSVADVTLA